MPFPDSDGEIYDSPGEGFFAIEGGTNAAGIEASFRLINQDTGIHSISPGTNGAGTVSTWIPANPGEKVRASFQPNDPALIHSKKFRFIYASGTPEA
jgi:hypothetical protein